LDNSLLSASFGSRIALSLNACPNLFNVLLLSRFYTLITALVWKDVANEELGLTGTLSLTFLVWIYD
jgi:hypothetical protein